MWQLLVTNYDVGLLGRDSYLLPIAPMAGRLVKQQRLAQPHGRPVYYVESCMQASCIMRAMQAMS